nr:MULTISPECIES: YlxR family protein [unclassified Cyanobium]
MRRCVACRVLADRRGLWRVVRLASGGLQLDQGMGRSAYLCPCSDCLEEARRRRRLQRSLRCQGADALLDVLRERLDATPQPAPGASSEAR